jgi:hypothetical protein
MRTGADIVQGFTGSVGDTPVDLYVQRCYEPRFLGAAPGDAVECDTRNMAARRAVFETLQFNEKFRRVSDTEFGLVAESRGFKIAYWPAMRIDHQHDGQLSLYLAKQVSHGWGAQRLVREMPHLRWHSGRPHEAARVAKTLVRLPGSRTWPRWLMSLTLAAGSVLDRRMKAPAGRLGLLAATALDKVSILLGHVLYEAGANEPWPDQVMRGQLRWHGRNDSS